MTSLFRSPFALTALTLAGEAGRTVVSLAVRAPTLAVELIAWYAGSLGSRAPAPWLVWGGRALFLALWGSLFWHDRGTVPSAQWAGLSAVMWMAASIFTVVAVAAAAAITLFVREYLEHTRSTYRGYAAKLR